MERHGVAHRDIKPDNIGIRSLTKQRNQLILFDFSLARAPLDNIRVGTPGYTDPFLGNRKPRQWDLDAERYSAAVTLYEMTLGAGVLPQWGDGKSDPAMTDGELVIEAEKFDPSVREGLVEFFRKALHREPCQAVPQRRRDAVGLAAGLQGGGTAEDQDPQRRGGRSPGQPGTGGTEYARCRPGLEHPCPQRPGAGRHPDRPQPAGVPDRRHPPDAWRRQPDPAGDHRLPQSTEGAVPQRRGSRHQGEAVTRRALGTAQPRTPGASDRRDQDSQEGRRMAHPQRPCWG